MPDVPRIELPTHSTLTASDSFWTKSFRWLTPNLCCSSVITRPACKLYIRLNESMSLTIISISLLEIPFKNSLSLSCLSPLTRKHHSELLVRSTLISAKCCLDKFLVTMNAACHPALTAWWKIAPFQRHSFSAANIAFAIQLPLSGLIHQIKVLISSIALCCPFVARLKGSDSKNLAYIYLSNLWVFTFFIK